MKLKNKEFPLSGFGLGILLFATLTGCFEPVEDCLDLNASNYNVSADRACPDCCIFPEFRIAMIHRMVLPDTTLTFQLNETYEDDFGQSYQISQLSYFFQGASWIKTNGSRIEVLDSVLLTRVENPLDTIEAFYPNDVLRVEGSNFQFESAGTFNGSGSLAEFELSLGLPETYVQVLPSSAPTGHPLSQDDLWTAEEGFAQCRMILVAQTPSDTLTKIIDIRTPQPLGSGIIRAPTPLELPPGFSTEITLQVDYRTWLRGVDTFSDSTALIADKITNNLAESFTLVSVVTDL